MHVANWINVLQFVCSLDQGCMKYQEHLCFFKTLANISMHHNGSTFVPQFTYIIVIITLIIIREGLDPKPIAV